MQTIAEAFYLKGKAYKRYGKLTLEASMKACRMAFNKALNCGVSRGELEANFVKGYNE